LENSFDVMTTFQKLDKALRAKVWTYDIGEEQFLDGDGKVIGSKELPAKAKTSKPAAG
jgi:hypothetical protein